MGSQLRQVGLGEDELAGVIDEQGHGVLAGGGFPTGSAEAAQGCRVAVGGVGAIAQLGAGQLFVTEIPEESDSGPHCWRAPGSRLRSSVDRPANARSARRCAQGNSETPSGR